MGSGIPVTRSITSLRMELREQCSSFSVRVRISAGYHRWCAEVECRKHGIFFWIYDDVQDEVIRRAYRVLVREHSRKITRILT